MKKFIIKYQYVLFAIVGAIIVLWQLLLPGYVLILDWIVGPHNAFSYQTLSDIVGVPSSLLWYFLQMFLPAWVVQKFVLVGVFFVLFYFPLRFYPFEKKYGVEYFASMLFVFNPFVYERILAGHWRVIVGYAFMFPLVYFLFRFSRDRSWRAIFGVFGTLLITGMWSVHFLVVGVIIVGMYVLVLSISYLRDKQFDVMQNVARKFLIGLVLFVFVSGYWVVPYMLRDESILAQFTSEHQIAFATATDENIGVVGNVLTMRGFWGEDHAWADQFIMPWSNTLIFYSMFFVIAFLSFIGVRSLWCNAQEKVNTIFLLVLFVMSIVWATGISAYGIWWFNQWFFDHVWFWSGFRDSQKWTGISVFMYALVGSVGVRVIVTRIKFARTRSIVTICAIFVPIIMVPQMFFGLWGQLHAVWYPRSWQEINMILQKDDECKAIFLPWHQYYTAQFNNDILIANPAHRYFDCDIIAGHNTELGDIKSIAGNIDDYHAIESVVTSNDKNKESIDRMISQMYKSDIKYIIFSHDLGEKDLYKYSFLDATEIHAVFKSKEISLYKIN